jgi:hypothetical protein
VFACRCRFFILRYNAAPFFAQGCPTWRPINTFSREEFTPEEYRKLHTFARKWIKEARTPYNAWYRTVAYNFVLIMSNTGMRPSEAKNLQWRDVEMKTDKEDRKFVVLNVRGKGKFRRILQGLPGWETVVADAQVRAISGSVNADAARTKPARGSFQAMSAQLLSVCGGMAMTSAKQLLRCCHSTTIVRSCPITSCLANP